jgi:hypothetical protein
MKEKPSRPFSPFPPAQEMKLLTAVSVGFLISFKKMGDDSRLSKEVFLPISSGKRKEGFQSSFPTCIGAVFILLWCHLMREKRKMEEGRRN